MRSVSSKSPTLRVALLGAGYIAEFHARAVKSISGAELVGVADWNRRRAETIAHQFGGGDAFGSLTEMLERTRPDVVHVLLPPNAHARAALEALEAGAHVLLEKPIATSIDECETIRAASLRSKRFVGTSHNFLFFPAYEQLRRDFSDGRLGQIDQLTILWNKFLPQPRSGPFDSWMLKNPRNVLLEICPHSFAHWLDLLGEPLEIEARAGFPMSLPDGGTFYRHWYVGSEAAGRRVSASFSFVEGYPEHRIFARGTLASATVDFERNTYALHRHRPLSLDFDRFAAVSSEAISAVEQATRTLASYALAKARLSRYGAPFQASITRSVETFYRALDGGDLDPRLGINLAAQVVRLAKRAGQASRIRDDISYPSTEGAVDQDRKNRNGAPAVLVTGATGFIGRELVRRLCEQGYTVRIVTRSESSVPLELREPAVEIVSGSLSDPEFVSEILKGVRHVVHLARSYGNTWEEFRDGDVEMTRRFAQACAEAGVRRFVYASSIAVYYAGRRAGTITEETPPDRAIMRTQPYARAKVASEHLLTEMFHKSAFPVVIVRPGIVVGAGGNPCHWGVAMWPYHSVCETWGRGDSPLPIVLVRDVADALVRCIEVSGIEGESFNLVGDTTLTAQDYLDAVEQGARIRLERRVTPIWHYYATDVFKWVIKTAVRHPNRALPSYRAWEARSVSARFDCSKAKRVLGWHPATDRDIVLREGIVEPAVEFFGRP